MPTRAANSLTALHTTFSVMPLPQTEPVLFTQRNIRPSLMCAIVVQISTDALTHSGTGTVRMWPTLSDQVDNGPVIFSLLKMIHTEIH
jgi:hypothetical protein